MIRLLWLLVAAAFVGAAGAASAQAPHIGHTALACIPETDHAVVVGPIEPPDGIQTVKLYFRSSFYPDFYYVEMTRRGDEFFGILPMVGPETTEVVYYVEVVDSVFNSARSEEFVSPVKEPCRDRPAVAYWRGETPGIIVGATTAGSGALPPGFSAVGIIGTITSAGIASSLGGGIGAGTAVAVGAGIAGGAAGAVVVATSGDEGSPATTSVVAVVPSSTTTVSTTAVPSGGTTPQRP